MGLEPEDSNGVQTEDIVKILQGHVKGGYTVSSFHLEILHIYIYCTLISNIQSHAHLKCDFCSFSSIL